MTSFFPVTFGPGIERAGFFDTILLGGNSVNAGDDVETTLGSIRAFPDPELRIPVARAGTLKVFQVNVGLNTLDVPLTATLLLDGSDTGLSVTIPAGQTGVFSASGSVSIAAGQGVSMRFSAGAGSGTANVTSSSDMEVTT